VETCEVTESIAGHWCQERPLNCMRALCMRHQVRAISKLDDAQPVQVANFTPWTARSAILYITQQK